MKYQPIEERYFRMPFDNIHDQLKWSEIKLMTRITFALKKISSRLRG